MAKSTNELSGGCLSLFGLPFLCAGLFMTWLYFNGYVKWWNAQNWEETSCWIESAELKTSHGSKGSTSYRATATYRYVYQGRDYHGDHVTFDESSDNIGSFHENAHRELSRYVAVKSPEAERDPRRQGGESFRCFVNPANPSESILYRKLRWEMQAFMAIFVLTFPAVGGALVIGGALGVRAAMRDAALRKRQPDEPWKWKAAWAGTAIPEGDGSWKSGLHLYTLWSGLIIVPLIAATAISGAFQQSPSSWLVLIFAALWAFPLWYSVKRLRHRVAVGSACFEPKDTPARPGGPLHGDIIFEKPLPLGGAPELTLYCEKSVTRGRGRRSSTSTERIWSDQELVPRDRITRDLSGYRLPVEFTLPADVPESDSGGEEPDTNHVWKLELKVPGTPIHSVFEVPVFRR